MGARGGFDFVEQHFLSRSASTLTEKIGFCLSLIIGFKTMLGWSMPPGNGVPDLGASKDRDSIVHLAKVLDLAAAAALKSDLAAVRGTSTVVDGSDVQRVGTQCAQVLLGACRTWQAENQTFEIVNASEALREGLNRLGVTEMLNVVEIVA